MPFPEPTNEPVCRDHARVSNAVSVGREKRMGCSASLADVLTGRSGNGSYPFERLNWSRLKRRGVQLLFLATPHETSRALVPEAIAQGLRVIDLSGAWRV